MRNMPLNSKNSITCILTAASYVCQKTCHKGVNDQRSSGGEMGDVDSRDSREVGIVGKDAMVFSQRTMKNILEKGILLRREQGFKGNSLGEKVQVSWQ